MAPRKAHGSRPSRWSAGTCAIVAGLALSRVALADSVILPAAADATLIEDPAGGFASGSGPAIFAGRIASTLQSVRRALLRFDVAATIPPGSKIETVRLRLHLAQANSGPVPARLYRLTQSWGEGASSSTGGGGAAAQPGDATWIHRFHDDVFWTHPGGDFDPLVRAETILDQPDFYTWGSTPEMVQDVQSWLDDPASNDGWLLAGDESRTQTARRFDSRELADPLLWPALEIVYSPACVPAPEGPGFWRQVCAAGLDEAASSCAAETLDTIGLPGLDACAAILAPAPPACDARAARKIAVLVLNLCSGRLQTSCPVASQGALCDSTTIGDRLFELGSLSAAGDCRRAAACSGPPD
ncbi:MAG TPA: DNRLRE domain-containing protein [Candidatus Polarisedimenticolia bacterium]|nr:DNRLRE domain-containing protein [Candidatus Polarisedimenticolia bacterium]